jgi:membrane-associated phospholipid phosphatase
MRQCDHREGSVRNRILDGLRPPVLPTVLRRPLLLTAALCALAWLGIGALFAGTSAASPLDDAIRGFATSVSDSFGFALLMDSGGEPKGAAILIVLISVVCVVCKRWRLAMVTVTSQGVIGSLTNLVKPLFDRTIHGPFLSYPSGHTAGATAFALVVMILLVDLTRARRSIAFAVVLGGSWAVGVVAAWAQTLLEAHYATDTIGGLFFATAVVVALGVLIDAVVDKLTGSPRPR